MPHMAMEPGMITSIEPGLYRRPMGRAHREPGAERAAGHAEQGAFGDIPGEFETLTLCPIDTRCIDKPLMRADEIDWLNRYHAEVRERLSPLVSGAALAWLELRTQPI
jgi:Xaa-Pro aminopeptidase